MHGFLKDLGLRQNRVEQMSILWHEVAMRRAIVVTGKTYMEDCMLALKEAEIKAEAVSLHIP